VSGCLVHHLHQQTSHGVVIALICSFSAAIGVAKVARLEAATVFK
jgi:hypothetical protein